MTKMSKTRFEKKAVEKLFRKSESRIKSLKISVAMMVGNESKNIARILRSLVNDFEEIVLTHTVPIEEDDGTRGIVKRVQEHHNCLKTFELPEEGEFFVNTAFGKKIHFSNIRNFSISQATGDWILIADSDEKFLWNDSDINDLKKFIVTEAERRLDKKTYNSIAVPLYDIAGNRTQMQFNSVRLFRKGSVIYEGRVHNRPVSDGDAVFCPNIYFFHYGYDLSPDERKKKEERTCGLLEEEIKEDPENTRAMYFLLQSYAWHGRKSDAINIGKDYLERRERMLKEKGDKGFNNGAFYTMARLLINKATEEKNNKFLDEAKELIDEGLKVMPKSLDLLQCMTEFGAVANNAPYVQAGARGFMRNYESFDAVEQGEQFVHTYNADAYVYCAYQLSRLQIRESAVLLKRIGSMIGGVDQSFAAGIKTSINTDLEEVSKCKI